jgi:mannitol/fructose-specific phosphotransferase system IIA component (Ntr-type)
MSSVDPFVCACRLEGSPRLTRNEAILQLLIRLAETGHLPVEGITPAYRVILNREQLGPTGIGLGVGVPHARCPFVTERVGAVGVVQGPPIEDYDALDGEPVDLVFLLLAPIPPPGERLVAEDTLVKRLRDSAWLNRLRAAADDEGIMAVVRGEDGAAG